MTANSKYLYDLILKEEIWHAPEIEKISYPENGNNDCFEIEDTSFWFKSRNRIIYEVVKKYTINGPIFDVGGGNGFVTSYLSKKGYESILVEPGLDGCLNAKKRGLKNIIHSVFDTAHFILNTIPNIGIFDVMEHINDQKNFLEGLHKLLIPDGRLIITVPAYNELWSEEDESAGHYRRYRIRELHDLMNFYGFEVLYVSYFFSFLVFPIFIFRTIPSKFGFYKISSQKSKRQHLSKTKQNILFDILMKFEINRVKKEKSILFGSSIILAVRKR